MTLCNGTPIKVLLRACARKVKTVWNQNRSRTVLLFQEHRRELAFSHSHAIVLSEVFHSKKESQMYIDFLKHMPGCTPVQPCVNCVLAQAIRSGELDEKAFAELVAKLKVTQAATVPDDASIDDLDLSVRGTLCLRGQKIETIGQLIQNTEDDLWKIPNLGRVTLNEIKSKLACIGRSLRNP
jgi:hypothetical protein